MSVWFRRIGIALAVLLLLLIAAAAWLIASFDPNRYKGVAIDWMKANRNRTLAIDGPIELSVFPRVAVKASQVKLSEAGRPDTFAAIDSAALAVDVMPLLRGELVVGRVEASGVRVTLTRDAKGRRNTDDLAGPADAKTPPAGEPKPAPAEGRQSLRFDVSAIRLADVRARLRDDIAKLDGELQVKELSTGRIADGVETPVTLALAFDFTQPAARGELSGALKAKPDLAHGAAKLADVDLRFAGNAAGMRFDDTTLSLKRFGFDGASQALAIEALKLKVKATRDGQPLGLELDWPSLDVKGPALKGSPFSGALTLAGAWPLTAQFRSGPPSGSFDALALPGFEATLATSSAQRKVDGTLRANLALQPAKGAIALDALDLKASLADPAGKPLALAARGKASASASAAQWALAGQVNSNQFQIDGSANLAGSTPAIKAQAKFDTLDLNTLLPDGASQGAKQSGTPAPADTPVDLSALRKVDANVTFRAGTLLFRQYRIADARVDAVLDGGMLRVAPLAGRAWGGQLDANVIADARASRVAVKATASGVDVNALLKDVAAKDILEGTGRVTLDVAANGRTVGELRSRLDGSAALQLRDGAVKGVNLAQRLRQAKAALSMRTDAIEKSRQTEKTDFSELSASFQIRDGIARSNDLDLKSPFLRLGGDGAIDIGKGRIDYTARATVASTAAGQGGPELAALKGLTIPVRLTGPFEAVDWNIQWSAVAAGALQNKVEDKLKEKLGDKLGLRPPAGAASGASAPSAKEQLKDKLLKGLFK